MDEGFLYSPMPNARGGFTTRAGLGRQITEAELDSAVSSKTGLPPEQCAQVLGLYLREMLEAAGSSRWSPGLYDLIRLGPTSGGSKAHPDEFRTAEDINAGVSLTFAAEVIRAWQKERHLVSQGARGLVTPVLASIICSSTERPDEYVSGGLITLRGQHMKIDRDDPAQGVFLCLENGTEIRCTAYARVTRLQMTALVPETVTGPIRLRVASFINGSVRSTVYPTTLQQVPAPIAQ